jgi:hypothetical protein
MPGCDARPRYVIALADHRGDQLCILVATGVNADVKLPAVAAHMATTSLALVAVMSVTSGLS